MTKPSFSMFFSSGSMPTAPKIEPRKALLLIDLQEDFTSPAGNLHVPNTAEFVTRLPSLISKFREKGQVVWANSHFQQPCPSVSPHTGAYSIILKKLAEYLAQQAVKIEAASANSRTAGNLTRRKRLPIFKDDEEAFLGEHIAPTDRCCMQDEEGSAISSILTASRGDKDMTITKTTYSAFADFSLVIQLRSRMISDLYICGSLSNIGVYATVLDAVQQGFNVTLIEDCLGYREYVCHVEAMRRMADDLGAQGIDWQELMDDLHGLLGEVVPESQLTRTFQLSVHKHTGPSQLSQTQKVKQWMQSVDGDSKHVQQPTKSGTARNVSPVLDVGRDLAGTAAPPDYDSPTPAENVQEGCLTTLSRKRSISERDELKQSTGSTPQPAQDVLSYNTSTKTTAKARSSAKKSKIDQSVISVSSSSQHNSRETLSSQLSLGQSLSTGHLESAHRPRVTATSGERTMSQPDMIGSAPRPQDFSAKKQTKQKQKRDLTLVGPDDTIGDGDSRIVHDVLDPDAANGMFHELKSHLAWQKMLHRTGEVPRLVAVQGAVAADGSMPIYRHPADESPPLLPFNETVEVLRQRCEILVGHELNHVLIQYYRTSDDNISEHSDKTLDIVRGSSIVNLSLGAMRTMTIRTKKVSQAQAEKGIDQPQAQGSSGPDDTQARKAQRIRLHHNSLFILGQTTNANWLHSIRADKRLRVEKSEDELAFNCERISLTFRNIGTFIDPAKGVIWGQGATGKTRAEARVILAAPKAENVGEEMIVGFGKENHLTAQDFDWDEVYGSGFDVINFEIVRAPGSAGETV